MEFFDKVINEKVVNKKGENGIILSSDGERIVVDFNTRQVVYNKKSFEQGCVNFVDQTLQDELMNEINLRNAIISRINNALDAEINENDCKKSNLEKENTIEKDLIYRIDDYKFVDAKRCALIEEENNIYYLMNYYKSDDVNALATCPDDIMKITHNALIAVKNGWYSLGKYGDIDFCKEIKSFLNKLSSENWIVGTVPGHLKTDNQRQYENKGVYKVLRDAIYLEYRFKISNNLIQRSKDIEEKVKAEHRLTDFNEELKTIALGENMDVNGKNVVIFDDITTSGCSLKSCRNLILNKGANKCVIVALGKTFSEGYSYGF